MTSRLAETFDWAARAFTPVGATETTPVQYDQQGKAVVYGRRWAILAAYCLGYFVWNMHSYRQTPVTPEYAKYFDKTNEFQPAPEYGIDFMVITDNIYLIAFYPLGGQLMDTFGLKMMVLGSIGQAISCWWWYLSFTNFGSVMLSRLLASISGVMVATALLRISMQWFPASQRAVAVAIGTVASTLGSGAALVVGPLFVTGDDAVDLTLKSCKDSFKDSFNISGTETLECSDQAKDDFCCVAPMNIDLLNLFLALFATFVAIYTIAVVQEYPALCKSRDAPPTPPSISGNVKKAPNFIKAFRLMFGKRNYAQICLADFVASGPPIVLYSTIARIFPPRVEQYSFYAAAIALVVAIPMSAIFAYYLGKTKLFYDMTAAGYLLGFLSWLAATICLAAGTLAADYTLIFLGILAVIFFSLWTVSVYELKMEYVFSPDVSLQGFVVAYDRTIINLSSLIFLAAIPPERYDTERIPGRLFTFLVGSCAMFIGVVLVFTMRDKRKYLRLDYERENAVEIKELGDEMEIVKSVAEPDEPEEGEKKKNPMFDDGQKRHSADVKETL